MLTFKFQDLIRRFITKKSIRVFKEWKPWLMSRLKCFDNVYSLQVLPNFSFHGLLQSSIVDGILENNVTRKNNAMATS